MKEISGEDRRRAEETEQRLREAEHNISVSKDAEVKSRKMGQKPGGARAGRTEWEFRRKKGEGKRLQGRSTRFLSKVKRFKEGRNLSLHPCFCQATGVIEVALFRIDSLFYSEPFCLCYVDARSSDIKY